MGCRFGVVKVSGYSLIFRFFGSSISVELRDFFEFLCFLLFVGRRRW